MCALWGLAKVGPYQTVGYGMPCVDLFDVARRESGLFCPLHYVNAMPAVVISLLRTVSGKNTMMNASCVPTIGECAATVVTQTTTEIDIQGVNVVLCCHVAPRLKGGEAILELKGLHCSQHTNDVV